MNVSEICEEKSASVVAHSEVDAGREVVACWRVRRGCK
jgi:hypothetical protein